MFKKQGGLGPAEPLNIIGEAFMARPELEWLFLVNDDNLCQPSALIQLLDRDVDFITGLYYSKLQPFEPILFDRFVPMTEAVVSRKSDRWYGRHLMQPNEGGVIPILACGDGCLLITRKVLERVPYPWWDYGETRAGHVDHDMVFSRKCREAGFSLYCDTDVLVDHMAMMAVRPYRDDKGQWWVKLVQGEGKELILPAAGWNV